MIFHNVLMDAAFCVFRMNLGGVGYLVFDQPFVGLVNQINSRAGDNRVVVEAVVFFQRYTTGSGAMRAERFCPVICLSKTRWRTNYENIHQKIIVAATSGAARPFVEFGLCGVAA